MERPFDASIFGADEIDSGHRNETAMFSTSGGRLTRGEAIEEFIYGNVFLPVCLFGIGGNLLNFVVLSQKSLTYMMERMEKSAHYGLIALAVSDLFVCVAALPSVFYGTGKTGGGFAHASFDFRLVHKLYGNAVINTFMLSSTWLTVTIAVSRYIAICHPLRARQVIGNTFTVSSLVAVALGSVLFNVPRFLFDESRSIVSSVHGGRRMYFVFPGPLRSNPAVKRAYWWSYFTLGIAVPFWVLLFCNAKLVVALRRSQQLRSQTTPRTFGGRSKMYKNRVYGTQQDGFYIDMSRKDEKENQRETKLRAQTSVRSTMAEQDQSADQSASRITLTFIVIIVLFVLLFVPAELLNFFSKHVVGDVYKTDVFNLAQAVGNLLQEINFAVNFVLYCIVNSHFRQRMYRLAQCVCLLRRPAVIDDAARGEQRTGTRSLIRVTDEERETGWARRLGGRKERLENLPERKSRIHHCK